MAVTWLTGGSHVDTLTAPKIHTHCARTHTVPVCVSSQRGHQRPHDPTGTEGNQRSGLYALHPGEDKITSFIQSSEAVVTYKCSKIKWEGKKAIECVSIASRGSLALGYSERCLQPEQTSDLQEGCPTEEEQNN